MTVTHLAIVVGVLLGSIALRWWLRPRPPALPPPVSERHAARRKIP